MRCRASCDAATLDTSPCCSVPALLCARLVGWMGLPDVPDVLVSGGGGTGDRVAGHGEGASVPPGDRGGAQGVALGGSSETGTRR
jgi:hypothetical protein